MYQYRLRDGQVLIPTEDFSKVKKTTEIINATTTKTHLEYPNGIIMDVEVSAYGVQITINRELVKNSDGNYELKES